jgi:hypothetical protein
VECKEGREDIAGLGIGGKCGEAANGLAGEFHLAIATPVLLMQLCG